MEEYILHPTLKAESDLLKKDKEYEAIKWMTISKASVTIANILYMDTGLMPWQIEGLELAQECIREYASYIDLMVSDELLIKKEVSNGNV